MTIFYRRPNADGTPADWQSGFAAVNEGYENRSGLGGGTFILATERNQVETHEAADANWTTSDYVKAIILRSSMYTQGSGTDRVDLRIEAADTNWINDDLRANAGTGFKGYGARAYTNTYRDLGTNYNTTFNGLSLVAEAIQQGMAVLEGHRITAWDFAVEVFEATPAKGEMAWYAEAGVTGAASITATFVGSHTAKSGNILVAAFANNSSSVPTIQGTGWTLLQNDATPNGTTHVWYVWWKESDGTETGAQVTGATNFSNSSLMVYEIEWSGGTPTIQSNKNVADEVSTVTSHATTGITPTNTTDNAVLALFGMEDISEWTFGLHITDADYQDGYDLYAAYADAGSSSIPVTARLHCCALDQNKTGSQSVTFQTESTEQDTGGPCWSVMVVINAVANDQTVATGLITENETLFSPVALVDQTITTGTITENETLFAAAAIPGAAIVATGTITENETLFALAPIPGVVAIATGTITENETLFTATPIPGAFTVTTGTITENETLFALAAVPGLVAIATGTITENETLFALAAIPGAVSVTTGLITENETLFPATPRESQTVATGLITENETLFALAAIPGAVSITTGLITENETLFPVAAIVEQTVATGTITENETLFAVAAVPGAVTVTTGLIVENETLFPVAVIAGAVSVTTGLITENETLFAVTPVPGATTITTGLITENETLFPVAPAAAISITTGLIVENETLFPVTALAGNVSIVTGLIVENETLFSASVGLAVLGGTYNAIEHFATGSTVTINLYDPVDGQAIPITSNACVEIPGTGVFIWDSSKLTTQPTGYQEYAWRMTDGINFEGGTLRMFDAQDSIRLQEIWQKMRLDPNNPVETDEDGSIRIGPNGSPIITIDAGTVGTSPNRTTTQTRQP